MAMFAAPSAKADAPKTDAAIRKALIAESRAAYSGNCPCPYDTDRAGRQCGKRSAYSRPGGAAPLCYDHDVTQEMIAEYRARDAGH
ncbi:hypothetical protein [Sorangium sp. So ce1000]|uniref:hypothetical protein n=1 Tax=Sorangium sp. So ce1000 TaxID=3133325 RepID=UPI003F5E388F